MSANVTQMIITVIKAIPCGKVATYGQIAHLAGLSNGARRVARILHSSSDAHNLPWHRVVRSGGAIALSIDNGADLQKSLLLAEGVSVTNSYTIDLELFGWVPSEGDLQEICMKYQR